MKVFFITILIFFSMYLFKDFFDNRGFCYNDWTYHHEKRLYNALEGMITDFIEHDKMSRQKWLKLQGHNDADINKTVRSLDEKYKKEREKILKYCHIDLTSSYYSSNPVFNIKMEHCNIRINNKAGNFELLFPWRNRLMIEYIFDADSYKFFNQLPYVVYEEYMKVDGLRYDFEYESPHKTEYNNFFEVSYAIMVSTGETNTFDKNIEYYEGDLNGNIN